MKDWPANGNDVDRADRLLSHGWPALAAVAGDMVEWLKASGAVRPRFCASLATAGPFAVEPIRAALQGGHEAQIERLLREVLPHWSCGDLQLLTAELEAHLQRGSLSGLNVFALVLLKRCAANTHAPLDEWATLLRRRLVDQLAALDEVDAARVSR